MRSQKFSFNDEILKQKWMLLKLSGVALFIGLTEALPTNIKIIGLDLTNNKDILGWFIFYIALFLLFKYIIKSVLQIIESFLPSLIKMKTDKTTGDTIGLSQNECIQAQGEEDEHNNIGTVMGELEEINTKNENIVLHNKHKFIIAHNIVVITSDFIAPIVFSIISMFYLYFYISLLN
jgi:hypothetical protein